MPEIKIGAPVRVYYDEEIFDEGIVTVMDDGIVVDFYDWIERWASADNFNPMVTWLEARMILVPNVQGVVVSDFRKI